MIIYICDDEKAFWGQIESVCRGVAEKEQAECRILHGENGEQVLQCEEPIDILILDIDMPVMDGIQVKNWLQLQKRDMNIIFVTNHQERMKDAFGLHVVGFVDKSRLETELWILLENCIHRLSNRILIEEKYDSREITYIEAEHVYSKLHSRQGEEFLVRRPLADLSEILEKAGFIRTHRSYLINMEYIEGAIAGKVRVAGTEIPVSVRLRTKVKDAYRWFCRENARFY